MKKQDLIKLRRELRSADSELIDILARRHRLISKIGLLKRKLRMGTIDLAAERLAMENFVGSATKDGLEEDYARRVAELVIQASVETQMRSRPPAASSDVVLKQFSEMMMKAERKGRKLIRFDIGEPRFRTPSAVISEARRSLSQSHIMLYGSSSGLTELTDAIARRLNEYYGTRLRQSNVLIFPGARFGIFAAIRTNVSSLDRVVICQPAWPAYESYMSLAGARALNVSTSLADGWGIDLTALEEALKLRPKMLILNYPCNPTGKVLPAKRFQEVMQLAKKYRTTVLSDEVYASYCTTRAPSVLECFDDDPIYINSFSKEFSMTGWRIAYAVAGEQKIERMRKLVATTLTNVPEFVQRAALAALNDPSNEARASRQRISRRLGMACEELRKGDFEFYPPDGGFYVFPRIRRRGVDSEKFVKHLFARYAVGAMPGSIFGGYTSFLRLAITESENAVRTGIRRVVKAMNEW